MQNQGYQFLNELNYLKDKGFKLFDEIGKVQNEMVNTSCPTSITPASNLVINECGETLNSSQLIVSVTDNGNPVDGSTRYDLWLDIGDGNGFYDSGNSVAYPTTTLLPATVPTDGRVIIKRVYTWQGAAPGFDDDGLPLAEFVECTCTAANIATVRCPEYDEMLARFNTALNNHINRDYKVNNACVNPNNAALFDATNGYANYPAFVGLIEVHKLVGQSNYIDEMVIMSDLYIDDGFDADGDGYHDWWSCNDNDYNDHHYEWRSAAGIGMFACYLINNPQLPQSTPAYISKLCTYLRVQVWEKWGRSSGTPDNHTIYGLTNATHMLARLVPVVHALDKCYGGTNAVTGRSYSDWLVNGPLNDLEDHLLHPSNNSNGACNIWGRVIPVPGGNVGGSTTPGTNDTPHANDVVVAMLYAAEHGLLDNPTAVLDCLCGALNDVIWDGSGFNFHVDGGSNQNAPSPNGWIGLVSHCPENKQAFIDWSLANHDVTANSHPKRMQHWAYLLKCCVDGL